MEWIYVLWFGYFWPSVKGNGPEALVQTVAYAAVAVAIYPPIRNWIKFHFEKIHADAERREAMLAHIIKHHPDIPEFKED